MLRRVARPHDAVVGFVPGLAGMHDVDDYPDADTVPGLVVYRYDSPLFSPTPRTSAATRWRRWREYAASGPVYWLLLNMEANVEVDITAMYALDALRQELTDEGTCGADQGQARLVDAVGALRPGGVHRTRLHLPHPAGGGGRLPPLAGGTRVDRRRTVLSRPSAPPGRRSIRAGPPRAGAIGPERG